MVVALAGASFSFPVAKAQLAETVAAAEQAKAELSAGLDEAALRERDPAYVAIDISGEHLAASAAKLAEEYPEIDVYAVCADYSKPIPLPPKALA